MNERYYIRKLTADDVEEVANLSAKIFLERQTLAKATNIPFDDYFKHMRKVLYESIVNEPLSYVCEDQTLTKGKQIIGFRFCKTLSLKREKFNDARLAPILALTDKMLKEWLRQHPEVANSEKKQQKILFFEGLGVKSGYERMGIATKLCLAALKQAKSLGYEMVLAIAVAEASQNIFANKLNFKEVYTLESIDFEFGGRRPYYGINELKTFKCFELELNRFSSFSCN
ncbi:uncharacterized protein B4U79_16436 [Dinothrombium tinctorium]|uniref:N-acetyltransferase domain-containing protein n=1 Tax=Dinothrombium tinctorium TaxID=1965070 RepID=A0A3S4QJA3_9ACAR|nr:uncharacterized protein B4U79_16462 [Dinothrombium tinctorium]RWS03979.1 uncharacterized protein B4U79_16461 [Dinothrombium tinctorium]RWS04184.1 uncharacterized protein B4U79_16437 [Dinothrombium tinctorium]RWS04188.1 uncharacterized protein B4U79_16436 [Dinothrombium tinctorium]